MAAWPLTRTSPGLPPPPKEDDVALLREQLSSLQVALESREKAIDELRSQAETIFWSFGSEVPLFCRSFPCIAYLKDAEGRYVFANQLWERVHQKGPGDWAQKTDAGLFPPEAAERYRRNDLEVLATGASTQTLDTISDGGETTYWLVTTFPVETVNGANRLIGGVAVDITARRLAEQSHLTGLERQANYDSLTALPNRLRFEEMLETALENARGKSSGPGLLWIDLDRFKEITEALGHRIGDVLLRKAAARLDACRREFDTVARLGGDEFVLLLPQIQDRSEAEERADAILESLRKPFHVDGHELYITASIGVCAFPGDGFDAASLQCNAERAMYCAKGRGRNTYHSFEGGIGAGALERLTLEGNLRHALERNEFELFYQPQFNLQGDIKGFEALIRWNHPTQGLLWPGSFIALAEDCGLIVPIGAWVVKQACRQLAAWKNSLPGLRIAVNVSALQFHYPDFVATVAEGLAESGIEPKCLEIELTESLVMRNQVESVRQLERLRELGISVALDDFGTGYSCLSNLRTLPIDKIKIDKSFLIGVENSTNGALVAAITTLARSLGLSVVAEGVERPAQLEVLKTMRVDLVQGYLLGHPQPASVTEQRFFT